MKQGKGLNVWQLVLLTLGNVIGASFFLGSAVAIHAAGPAILLAFIFGGLLVYFILFALSEMTVANPAVGSFRSFASQVFGRGAGFVVGWVYWTGMVLTMSSEATAISILVRNWAPDISIAILGNTVIISVTLLNLLKAKKISTLTSGLAAIKLLAIVSFIIIAFLLVIGLFPGTPAIGIGELVDEPLLPGGFAGIAGSMIIVIFTYAGFEIIGLAASEADRPKETIPKAIRFSVIILVGLYIVSIALLLPLIPTAQINESTSPIVAALGRQGFGWAGNVINVVLISAIFSTMLAAMFGLGRMMRSLVDEDLAPVWLKDKRDIPYRGILSSGITMLLALGFGLLFPRVYLFLISSGGFALLFSYIVIMFTHIRFRRRYGCPPDGKCQMWGFPYTSYFVLFFLIVAVCSMPFIEGQTAGLIAGSATVVFFLFCYLLLRFIKRRQITIPRNRSDMQMEPSRELTNRND